MIVGSDALETFERLLEFIRIPRCPVDKVAVYNTSRFSLLSGAIFHAGDEEHMAAFLKAAYEVKFQHVAPTFELQPITKQVEVNTDSFKTAAAGLYEYSILSGSFSRWNGEPDEISLVVILKQTNEPINRATKGVVYR